MNFKTTIVLLALVLVVGLGWMTYALFLAGSAAEPPEVLRPQLREALTRDKSDERVRIVLKHGGSAVDLVREPGQARWTMPGKWPTRADAVRSLLQQLTGLESRFAPAPLTRENEKAYGLDRPAVTVTVTV